MVGDNFAADMHAEAVRQVVQAPGVFRGDDVRALQQGYQPRRCVAHIADRRGCKYHRPGGHFDTHTGGCLRAHVVFRVLGSIM